jgi:sugar/nucleoside kinase (ribokinase family)
MIYFPDKVKGPVLGGPPAYCGMAASCQGTSTGLVTKIGPDMTQSLLRPFTKAGVDIAGIRDCGKTTVSELIYDAKGNKEIRYPCKADTIKADDVPVAYHDCRIIYVCTMDNDVLPQDLDGVVSLGQCRAVDLGGYGGVHMSKANRQAAGSLANLACSVAEHFDIVKASDEDARSIFGDGNPEEAARKLLDCGPEVVVITLGAEGALVRTAGNNRHVPSLPARMADVTGGGDTFMAGFLSEYLRSADPLQAAQWGCATAVCVIEKSGGVCFERMPARPEVQKRVNDGYGKKEKKGGK